MLLMASAVMGLGAGVLDMVLSPIVCALLPHDRNRALNRLHAFYCIGALGTVLAGSAALRLGVPWRLLAAAMIAVPLAMFLGFIPMRIPPLVHEDNERTPLRVLARQPFFLAALVAITFCGATEQGMSQWLPAYAERVLGFSKSAGGLALAAFSIGMIAGRTAAGTVTRRIRPLPMMLAGCGGCILGFIVGCSFPVPGVALGACVAVGVAVSVLWPTTLGIAADHFPHGGASMFSVMAAGGNFGCFVMPWVIGAIAQRTTLSLGLVSTAVCPLLLAVILVTTLPSTGENIDARDRRSTET